MVVVEFYSIKVMFINTCDSIILPSNVDENMKEKFDAKQKKFDILTGNYDFIIYEILTHRKPI